MAFGDEIRSGRPIQGNDDDKEQGGAGMLDLDLNLDLG